MRATLVNWLVEIHVSLGHLLVLVWNVSKDYVSLTGPLEIGTRGAPHGREALGRRPPTLQSRRDSVTTLRFGRFLARNQTRLQAFKRESSA